MSGKLRAQRAKSMKFKDGYMISSGQPVKEYIDAAVRHVLLRQVSSLVCFSRGLQLLIVCLHLFLACFLVSHWVSVLSVTTFNRECLVSRSRSCLTGILRARWGQ